MWSNMSGCAANLCTLLVRPIICQALHANLQQPCSMIPFPWMGKLRPRGTYGMVKACKQELDSWNWVHQIHLKAGGLWWVGHCWHICEKSDRMMMVPEVKGSLLVGRSCFDESCMPHLFHLLENVFFPSSTIWQVTREFFSCQLISHHLSGSEMMDKPA